MHYDKKKFEDFLIQLDIHFQKNQNLQKYNTFRIKTDCDFLVSIDNINKLKNLQNYILNYSIPYFILGGGSNLLLSDIHLPIVIIQLQFNEKFKILQKINETLEINIPSNYKTRKIAKKISQKEYTGMEFLTTIPGKISGAIFQNAGCYGREIKDIVQTISFVEKGTLHNYTTTQCHFSYRESIFKNSISKINIENKKNFFLSSVEKIITSITIQLQKGNITEIENKIKEYSLHRKNSQPKNRKSAGSVFKNPKEEAAWRLIDAVDLRGFSKNDAQISTKHSNFIVNNGNAKAADIYYLIQIIQEKVYNQFNIQLKPEIQLLGEF